MIHQFRVQNYKALRDVTLDLNPVQVLIGPNDSGKTSLLEALAAYCRSVDHDLAQAFTGCWDGTKLVWNGRPDLAVSLSAIASSDEGDFQYGFSVQFAATGRRARLNEEQLRLPVDAEATQLPSTGDLRTTVFVTAHQGHNATPDQRRLSLLVSQSLRGVQYYRWNPRMLALPVVSDSKRRFRMESDGFGLAQCLDDVLGDDRARFTALESRFREIFPQVKSIKLKAEPAYHSPVDNPENVPTFGRSEGKGIYFALEGMSEPIAAAQVSDGVLLVLAYLTILYLPQAPRLVLVEEPENGIHPKRLEQVIRLLRDLIKEQTHSQVVLTTHSPYVVDQFLPDEVTLCRKEPDGAVTATNLTTSEKVREQIDVFTLGEIWTAEGDDVLAGASAAAGDAAR